MHRYIADSVQRDLKEKMVFIGGPRQVGKTTLAFQLLEHGSESHPAYLNWDVPAVKKSLISGTIPGGESLLVLDEIHKFKGWRNLVKGLYDTNKSSIQFLITGSARLDYYRKGGDSLQGRYHYHRLHPLSVSELSIENADDQFDQLFHFGGFPEPFLKSSKRHWKRWQRERRSRVIQEDLLNLENVRDISSIELLADVLPDRISSPISINNLSGDLQVSFDSVDKWIKILENLYYCFRIKPWHVPKLRAAKKEQKLYMWDWSLCENEAAKFENMVASHLLKFCHWIEDNEGDDMALYFLRDSQKREIDFIVAKNKKPLFGVECKLSDTSLSKQIPYFAQRTNIPQFYQVHLGKEDRLYPNCNARVIPFVKFCHELQLL